MLQLAFGHPRENEEGLATLRASYSESYVDERIVKEFAEVLRRENLIPAIASHLYRLRAIEGLPEAATELEKFLGWLKSQPPDLIVMTLAPIFFKEGPRQYVRLFRFELRRRTAPGKAPRYASAPSWARPHLQDPAGSP